MRPTMDVIDAPTFDCMLCTLQCINSAVKIYEMGKPYTLLFNGRDVTQNNMMIYMRKLWETFPIGRLSQSPEKVCFVCFLIQSADVGI